MSPLPVQSNHPGLTPKQYKFWCLLKAHIFLIIIQNKKKQLKIHHIMKFTTENVLVIEISILILFYIVNNLIPSVTYIFLPRMKKKQTNKQTNMFQLTLLGKWLS